MSGFVQALRAYREGALSREGLLTEVERQLAERHTDAVALLKLLNEEHARVRLPDSLHGAIAARILHWRDPHPSGGSPKPLPTRGPGEDGTQTIIIEHEAVLEEPADALVDDPDPLHHAPIGVGSVLQGRFKLIEAIGQGGMSSVFKAIDLRKVEARSIDPYVAVKLLTVPSSGFGHSLALLQSEAQKLQSLPHPNIVRVIDCDRDGRTVFMTMEYLSGEPLKRILLAPDFRGMSAEDAEPIIEGIATALDFAHRNGIIHGDLKPGNVIITDKGEVKVIDFGIARLMTRPLPPATSASDVAPSPTLHAAAGDIDSSNASDAPTQTPDAPQAPYAFTTGPPIAASASDAPTHIPGTASPDARHSSPPHADDQPWLSALTPLYASPEMLEQRGPDPRDDVYALACIAHELLTGQHPFDDHSALDARDAGMKPLRHRNISRGRFKAIAHGLEFDRERRTLSAGEFLAEFRTTRRHSLERTLLMSGIAVLLLLIGVYFVLRGRLDHTLPLHRANLSASLASFEMFRDCPTCPLMKVLPPGRFSQGENANDPAAQPFDQPQHPVAINYPFGIGVYEVTVGEFREFVDATQRKISGCSIYDGEWHQRADLGWFDPGYPQTSSHPVACVSWRDAEEYTNWLSHKSGKHYRLPSASEWEYAARAGADAVRPWSTNTEWACNTANVADLTAAQRYPGWKVHSCKDGYVYSAPVGSFKPNAFGLYDMLGNVFEWVQDCWHPDYRGSPSNGSAWQSGDCGQRDLRGGSWFTSPQLVSVAARNHFDQGYRSSTIGFRLVREVE